ncbi:hypothetical protein Scep_013459 [Stephania cephalantha]|uniref:Uncharacterized protein n=1 Tax=Stephania cephalantha TaxID=152367 RepID=A0AAP0PAT1_9MAGN
MISGSAAKAIIGGCGSSRRESGVRWRHGSVSPIAACGQWSAGGKRQCRMSPVQLIESADLRLSAAVGAGPPPTDLCGRAGKQSPGGKEAARSYYDDARTGDSDGAREAQMVVAARDTRRGREMVVVVVAGA